MKYQPLATRWEGADLVVLRHGQPADRIAAAAIERVILVCSGGDTPSELDFVLIETATEHVLLPAGSGIAARVYFERQAFWTGRACIYWTTSGRQLPLPRRLYPGIWLLRRHRPAFLRLPRAELAALVAQWPLEGPQTWEQRKWAQLGASRHHAAASSAASRSPQR
jgi:hypothetical protein